MGGGDHRLVPARRRGCGTAAARRAAGPPEAPGHPAPHPPGAGPALDPPDRRSRTVSRCSRIGGSCSSCRLCTRTISATSRARAPLPGLDDRRRPPREAATRAPPGCRGGRSCSEQRPHGRTSYAKISGLNTATAAEHWTRRRPPACSRRRGRRLRLRRGFFRQRLAGRSSQWHATSASWQETVVAVNRASDEPERILKQNSVELYRLATPPVPLTTERT